MKKFLIVLFLLIVGGVAALLFLPTSEPAKTDEAAADAAPQKVISTAEADKAKAKAKEPEKAVEGAEDAAADAEVTETPEAEKDVPADEADIISRLVKTLGVPAESIRPAPIPGWYEVANGSAIGYISGDGNFLIDGDLIDLKTRVNLTEARRNGWRKTVVSKIGESNMIIFEPKKAKHTVTVFTDVDCGYCRKLHSEIQGYMDEGIRVRYVFYPLRGEDAPSYKTAENVWCSKDRQNAMTLAKQGKKVTAEACDNPVNMHLQTGIELGIRGTPGMITETGQLLPGYMPPKALLQELEKGAEG